MDGVLKFVHRYHGVEYVQGPRRRRPSLCRRLAYVNLGVVVYLLVWTSILMFNVQIQTETGESVPLRTAAARFFRSEAWREMRRTVAHLYGVWAQQGWRHARDEMARKFDTTGVWHARQVSRSCVS